MGADGHIYITNPDEIVNLIKELFVIAILAILGKKNELPDGDEWCYEFTFTENELSISFSKDDENETKIKTIKMDHTQYWTIYNKLVGSINNSLTRYPINWDHIYRLDDEWEIEAIKGKVSNLDEKGMNYTYWDTEGYFEYTFYDYLDKGNDKAPREIYKDMCRLHLDKSNGKVFKDLFPSVENFLSTLIEAKEEVWVSYHSEQLWT